MTKARPQVLALNGGEVDREVIARSDLESYANRAQVMENALPGLKGGMYRAPGSRFLGFTIEAPGEDSPCYVRTWRYARSQAFTVEMSAGRMRLLFGIGFVQVGGGDADVSAGWVDASTGGGSTDPNAPPWLPTPEAPGTGGGGNPTSGDGGPSGIDPLRPGQQPDEN